MKTNPASILLFALILSITIGFGQQTAPANAGPRITFMLKNTLGYARMFRAVGPGMDYGFTMGKRETVPCNWPVGSKLYFSHDGKTNEGLILTVTAEDEGKILGTGNGDTAPRVKPTTQNQVGQVSFRLHNTSLLPKKVTLISYAPGESGNGTNGFMLAPKGNRTFTFPIGTRLYLATSDQVDIVMSGKRIDSGKPFLTVQQGDAGRAFDID
ncbi:hypothetical protein [Spirosoma utsteinense]|uniref:Uncharacterized protein n=1 Tax=Spirosoma utsteinense TaxID=2585773 RepID=A0ABR6W667_9BACT|nr:hypothetical protein [Spirosoma utsteinense]MBC3785910.1 hypothetical protein [Spirosoma utsteinense]MBC3792082.1 hypothetical protein [Spirosoma utsteinense]